MIFTTPWMWYTLSGIIWRCCQESCLGFLWNTTSHWNFSRHKVRIISWAMKSPYFLDSKFSNREMAVKYNNIAVYTRELCDHATLSSPKVSLGIFIFCWVVWWFISYSGALYWSLYATVLLNIITDYFINAMSLQLFVYMHAIDYIQWFSLSVYVAAWTAARCLTICLL